MRAKIRTYHKRTLLCTYTITFENLMQFSQFLLTWKRETGLILEKGVGTITHLYAHQNGEKQGCEPHAVYLGPQELNDPDRIYWRTDLVTEPTTVSAHTKKVKRKLDRPNSNVLQ